MKQFKIFLNESILDNFNPQEINEILKGYIEAAFFTEDERLENDAQVSGLDVDVLNVRNIDPNSIKSARQDISKFLSIADSDAVQQAMKDEGLVQIGRDIWLDRNGHGSGAQERSYNFDVGDNLHAAAAQLGEVHFELGDDGVLRFI